MADGATYDVGRIEATMTLDSSPFQTGLDASIRRAATTQAEIDRLLHVDPTVDQASFDAQLEQLKATASGIGHVSLPVWADFTPFWADMAVLRAEVAGLPALSVKVDVDTMGALADLAALEALGRTLNVGSGGDGASALGAATGAAGGSNGSGSGGFWQGLLGALIGGGRGRGGLLWGGGSGGIFGLGAGLAGMGSLGAFAGLGPEHVLMTLIGLAGNAAGAVGGGALLGLGSLGVMGTGMATDAAGIGQALNDTTAVVQAQNALTTAVQTYGAASTQAAAAQAQLNATLNSFSPIAKQAVLQAANTAQQFHQLFNAATGAAEATGAQILTQIMQTGEQFLGILGVYADQNMHIIQAGLQPLFTWIGGPGKTIFIELERIFQTNLPIAVHAFTQGLELLLRTIGLVAPQTGGLIRYLDQLFTRLNGPGWGQFVGFVDRLIGDFRAWEALIKIAAQDVYELFHADAGTGAAIVATLTQMLTRLHEWETSVSGQASLHNLFETHKQEVVELLNLLPPLISIFGRLELTIGPPLTRVTTAFAELLAEVLKLPGGIGVFATWGLGIGLLLGRLNLLRPLLGPVLVSLRNFGAAAAAAAAGEDASAASTGLLAAAFELLTGVGVIALAVGIYELYTHLGLMRTVMIVGAAAVMGLAVAFMVLDAVPIVALIVGIALGVAALAVGIIELATHWKTVWDGIKKVAEDVFNWLKSHLLLVALFNPLLAGLVGLATHWKSVWNGIKQGAEDVWHALTATWDKVESTVKTAVNTVASAVSTAWNAVLHVTETVWGAVSRFLQKWWPLVLTFETGGLDLLYRPILAAWAAISRETQTEWNAIAAFLAEVWRGIDTVLRPIVHGLTVFFTAEWNATRTAAVSVWNAIGMAISAVWTAISTAAQAAWEAITTYLSAEWNAIRNTAASVWDAIHTAIISPIQSLVGDLTSLFVQIVSAIGTGLNDALNRALMVASWFVQVGEAIVKGILTGIKNMAGSVVSAVKGLAQDALNGVKGILGIRSPSVVFAEQVGQPIAQGIGEGISQGRGHVTDALTGLFGPGARTTGSGVSVNVQAQADPQVTQLLAQAVATLKAYLPYLPQVGGQVAGALNQNASASYVQARGRRLAV